MCRICLARAGRYIRQVLHTLAAFRMAATWDTLRALLIGEGKPCADNHALDVSLTELEDRRPHGLGQAGQPLRPASHCAQRGLGNPHAGSKSEDLYRDLHTYFDAVPRPPEWDKIDRVEDLTPTIELFDKLIGLERYENAYTIFREHLEYATLYRLSASRLRVELLEQLFPDGVDIPPRLERARDQSYTLNSLASAYYLGGEPSRTARLLRRAAEIDEHDEERSELGDWAPQPCVGALLQWPASRS